MDRVAEYKEIVRRVMDEYADYMPEEEGMELERIYDDLKGHYELLYFGWRRHEQTHGIILHLDVRGEKVWIWQDGTEHGIALDLLDAGIPKAHIVLAFHAPYKRPYTGGFAVS